jgi:hypothetical protein
VNTGWYPETGGTASDILCLWGMDCILGSYQTDVFTLSLSYDASKTGACLIATPDGNGNWINAVDQNLGGAKTLVPGPWKAGYALGSYGIDAATKTVWAVLNYNSYFAAVAGVWPSPAMLTISAGRRPRRGRRLPSAIPAVF